VYIFPLLLVLYIFSVARSIPVAIASCAVIGAAMGTFDYAGALAGDQDDTKEERRKRFFKPSPNSLVVSSAE
jgi:hypothetical protein